MLEDVLNDYVIILWAWDWCIIYLFLYFTVVIYHEKGYLWPFASRFLAMCHALGNVYMATKIIYVYGLENPWEYNFYFHYPEAVDIFNNMNGFMGGYLIADALVLFIHNKIHPKNVDNDYMTIIHHIVGASSMAAFIWTGKLQFNSLYYSLTELSTIPLHISWAMLHLNIHKNPSCKNAFTFCSLSAAILFLILRIIGSFFVCMYLIQNYESIIMLPLICQIYAFVGNGIITILNFIWFTRIVRMGLRTMRA